MWNTVKHCIPTNLEERHSQLIFFFCYLSEFGKCIDREIGAINVKTHVNIQVKTRLDNACYIECHTSQYIGMNSLLKMVCIKNWYVNTYNDIILKILDIYIYIKVESLTG